jgi:hypothetical protein
MVRIEEVGRTAAVAVPIDVAPLAAPDSEDALELKPRRRGRRGGRRRSTDAEPAAEELAG